MRTVTLLSTCFLLLALLPRPAGAKTRNPRASAAEEARSKAAKIACAAGDFRKGVEILARLYVETDDTTYIYNQGRCYEQNHQWVSAIDRFREFLRKTPGGAIADGAEAEKHISDCRAFQAEAERQVAPPDLLLPPPSPSVAMPASQPPAEPIPAVVRPVVEHERPGSALPAIGVVVGGVGLASIATAILLNVKANQAADSGLDSNQESYKTGAVTCYAAGGALLVTGVILYIVGYERARKPEGNIAMSPLWFLGGWGLGMEGDF